MPDQLFTYYLENPLVIISINIRAGGSNVFWLEIETWVTGEGGTRREVGKGLGG
jgi:hypothetical protein